MSFNAFFHYQRNSQAFRAKTIKLLFSLLTVSTMVLFLYLPVTVYAAEKAYEGDVSDLQTTPTWFLGGVADSLFPGTYTEPLSSDNSVTVNYSVGGGMTNPAYVFGGLSESDNATNNRVEILYGQVDNSVYGGLSIYDATSNTVTVNNGLVGSDVFGGYSLQGDADNNYVTINGGEITYSVFGGDGGSNADNNSVIISGGTVGSKVYGGSGAVGNATNNSVTISGGTVDSDAYGGYSDSGNADNNSVAISGGTAGWQVYGGYSDSGNADNNSVIVTGGSVSYSVFGGWSNISGSGNANNNSVDISGGVVSFDVVGGVTYYGNANNNNVTISGGTIINSVYGGQGVYSSVNNNNVTISGGTVGVDAYGSGIANLNVYGGWSMDGDANNNSVTISGGELGGNVYGGYIYSFAIPTNYNDAINNTVTISGSPTLTNSYIYGGYLDAAFATQGGDTFSGNTLNFKSSNITAAGVGNFQYYNFYLPANTAANDTMLLITDNVDLTNANASIYLQGRTLLQVGDTVSLINSGAGVSNYSATTSQVSLGAFLTLDFDVYAGTNDLWAKLTSVSTTSNNSVLTDSHAVPLALVSQGADMAVLLGDLEVSGDNRLTAFAFAGGGSSTYSAGSDVDVDSFSLLAGVTWNAPLKKNSLALSAFIEAGWGSYDTYNDWGGGNVIRGDGDTDYYGGGLHLRYKWDRDTPGGLYAEGALRFGRMSTDFNSRDLLSGTGFSYDSDSNYYGVHAGLGYIWQLSGKTRIDVSGKYLWTRLDSDNFTASNGDEIGFDSADSHRLRAGFRVYHDYGNANAVTLYYGAAYEYEFDGDIEGRLYGAYAMDGSSLSGGSGIGELGVMFRPSKGNDRLTMQLGVQGYVGVREGFSGMLKLQYAF